MSRRHRALHSRYLVEREAEPQARPPPIPHSRSDVSPLFHDASVLVKKSPPGFGSSQSSGSSSSSSSSESSSKSSDKKGGDSSTLPIALGVVIPLVAIIAVLVYLHRRHLRKLRSEDSNDKHGSLDFGMDGAKRAAPRKRWGKNKHTPEMTVNEIQVEKPLGRGRGLSMDMGSPYLLPPGLHSSRESLHSLSRRGDDRYRPATTFIPNDTSSTRSYPNSLRRGPDDASTSTRSSGRNADTMNHELLKNASRMSRSSPTFRNGPLPDGRDPTIPSIRFPEPTYEIARKGLPASPRPTGLAPPAKADDVPRDSYIEKDGAGMRKSNNYLGALINVRDSSIDTEARPSDSQAPQEMPTDTQAQQAPPSEMPSTEQLHGRPQSMQAPIINASEEKTFMDDTSLLGGGTKPLPPYPQSISHDTPADVDYPSATAYPDDRSVEGLGVPTAGYNGQRLSMSFRPLPPEDPSDDPEQRANRIRSFYKEYFDDSKPGPFKEQEAYYEDYGQEYLGDAALFDPDSGNFVVAGTPFAEPITRRAMTPPPRAPPRFRGPPRSHGSSMSGLAPPGPRAMSASGQMGPPGPPGRGRPPAPRKPKAPPAPLHVLPTPHMLKEDSFVLPIDFAPPKTYRDRQIGRPESPRGGLRPFSPMVPAHLPMASSFDDLSAMPSPHALRQSGTFTALDFAPPPRFKNSETGSDAGSIRSNRSGVSAVQLHSIRAGAYRVSRIPKGAVGTKADTLASLRPTWDMS